MDINSVTALLNASQQAFAAHLDEGLAMDPAAAPSHLCWRTANQHDFQDLIEYSREIGDIIEREHHGNRLIWVMLRAAVEHHGRRLQFLEITAPRKEDHETCPAMLVYAKPAMHELEVVRNPAPSDPRFTLRFQQRSAMAIIFGMEPAP